MATKTTTKPMTDFERASQDVTDWTATLAAAREDLAQVDTSPALAAATAKKQAGSLATGREFIVRCEVALEAAIGRRDDAARAQVAAEAEDLQPQIDAVRAELAEHDKATEELLAPLRAHTGRDWVEVDPFARRDGMTGTITAKTSTRERIRNRMRTVEAQQAALRAAARGEDPITVCEDLPASLQPGGVLPSASLVERQRRAEEQAAQDAEEAAQLAEAQRTLDDALRSLGVDVECEATSVPGDEWAAGRGRQWMERYAAQQRARGIGVTVEDAMAQTDRLTALETVAALAGWDDAGKVASALPRHPSPATGPDAA